MNIIDYLKQFKPSLDRSDSKYYSEMQQLSYNLVKYLSMNNDKNEQNYQGNYNLTYISENMTPEDFEMITSAFMRNISLGALKKMIKTQFCEGSSNLIDIDNLESQANATKKIKKYAKKIEKLLEEL